MGEMRHGEAKKRTFVLLIFSPADYMHDLDRLALDHTYSLGRSQLGYLACPSATHLLKRKEATLSSQSMNPKTSVFKIFSPQ
jgi:hypothetical protein